ncbi:MAG TPA: hypothetical protein VKG43_04270 [Acidimicrobiales bacterium]|nr:hypothetical protein [Acidimicrobiales bacterium]
MRGTAANVEKTGNSWVPGRRLGSVAVRALAAFWGRVLGRVDDREHRGAAHP